jgi:hypothetical protein
MSPTTPEQNSRATTPETPAPKTPRTVHFQETMGPSSGKAPKMNPTPLESQFADFIKQLAYQLQADRPTSNPKVEDPELYHGERTKLRAFLTQCELKFNCESNKFKDDKAKVNYASSRCRGNAWSWIEPSIVDGASRYTTWKDFKAAVERAFGEADSKEVARLKFKAIRQGTRPASQYWAEFEKIISDLDYNDAIYIDQFKDGLHLDVQRQLALLGTLPKDITDFANKAILLDNRLFNFRMMQKKVNPWTTEIRRTTTFPSERRTPRLPDPEPMDLDATRRPMFKKLSDDERNRRIKERLCFICADSGHGSRNCPKRQGPTRNTTSYRVAEVDMDENEEHHESGKDNPQE